MEKEEIAKGVRSEAAARIDELLAKGRYGGEIACPNHEEHIAEIIVLKDGRQAIVCPECGHEEIR